MHVEFTPQAYARYENTKVNGVSKAKFVLSYQSEMPGSLLIFVISVNDV
jgi:hypothetical protein